MNTNKKSTKKLPMKYWKVDFVLTSDEIISFYVKARTQFDAYEKADGYTFWLDNEQLKNHLSNFKLMV